jgi:hypothetical protein
MTTARYPAAERGADDCGSAVTLDPDPAVDYVRHACGAKGTGDGPTLDENEYVRYLTVGRHKPVLPARRRGPSGDRLDEVF